MTAARRAIRVLQLRLRQVVARSATKSRDPREKSRALVRPVRWQRFRPQDASHLAPREIGRPAEKIGRPAETSAAPAESWREVPSRPPTPRRPHLPTAVTNHCRPKSSVSLQWRSPTSLPFSLPKLMYRSRLAMHHIS